MHFSTTIHIISHSTSSQYLDPDHRKDPDDTGHWRPANGLEKPKRCPALLAVSLIASSFLLAAEASSPEPLTHSILGELKESIPHGKAKRETFAAAGQPFQEARRITVTTPPANFWEVQLSARNREPIAGGDHLVLTFSARSLEPEGQLGIKVQSSNSLNDISSLEVSKLDLSAEWKEFRFPFTSRTKADTEKMLLVFFFGQKAQTVEIGGIDLVRATLAGSVPAAIAPAGTPRSIIPADLKLEWGNVAIGGGGWCLEVTPHAKVPGLLWMRSDVGGPWKRTADDKAWRPMALTQSYEPRSAGGVGSLILHPTEPNIAYAERGDGWQMGVGLFKTTDGGTTWKRVLEKFADGNRHEARKWGNPVALDPQNPDIIYWGTRTDGVWRSLDAGATWRQVFNAPAVPAGKDARAYLDPGIRSLVIDASSTTGEGAEKRSAHVYFFLHGSKDLPDVERGLYVSKDGGETFSRDAAFSEMAGNEPIRWMSASADGVFYAQNLTGAYRHDPKTGWTNVTPSGAKEMGTGIAVDPNNSNHLIAWGKSKAKGEGKWFHFALFRSEDGGKTWTFRNNDDKDQAILVPSGNWQHKDILAPSSLTIDPHDPKRAYGTDAYAVWQTDDVWAPVITWTMKNSGIENIIPLAALCPPVSATGNAAPLYTGVSDCNGFRHPDPHVEPTKQMKPDRWDDSEYNTGFDYCEGNPDILMVVRQINPYNKKELAQGPSTIMLTTDGGQKWKELPKALKANYGGGKIALSAKCTSPADLKAVFAPGNGQNVRYTHDGGQTWNGSLDAKTNEPVGPVAFDIDAYTFYRSIAADRVDADTFYLYRYATKEFLVSRDGGKTFTARTLSFGGAATGDDKSPVWIEAAPGCAGEVWAALSSGGIWRTRDFGATWQEMNFLEFGERAKGKPDPRPMLFAFGKPAPGKPADEPTVYLIGRANGEKENAIFMTHDIAKENASEIQWQKISDWPFDSFDSHIFAADRQTFGRLYLSGVGFVMGEVKSEAGTSKTPQP